MDTEPGYGGGGSLISRSPVQTVIAVPLHTSVTAGVIVLAVVGGLVAGSLGNWRIVGSGLPTPCPRWPVRKWPSARMSSPVMLVFAAEQRKTIRLATSRLH